MGFAHHVCKTLSPELLSNVVSLENVSFYIIFYKYKLIVVLHFTLIYFRSFNFIVFTALI